MLCNDFQGPGTVLCYDSQKYGRDKRCHTLKAAVTDVIQSSQEHNTHSEIIHVFIGLDEHSLW